MDTHDIHRHLDRLHDHKLRELLLDTGIIQHFDTGVELLRTGQYIKVVPIVLQGSLRVLREDESGREILLYFIRPGESCIMTLFAARQNKPSMVRAVVDEPVEMLLIPVDMIHRELSSHKDWLDFTFSLFLQRYEELLGMINDIAFSQVDDRLLDLLRTRSRHSEGGEIHATHQQLADELGSAREVVTRLLKKLEAEGVIETGRGKIRLLKQM
ncbi:MAG: Crp/Fnr family transcriptional regulator [Bacteroidetes bacterium]|nr:MAG: Crp/Fnr family transcriptional regulator [Bacteroidota bacterium]